MEPEKEKKVKAAGPEAEAQAQPTEEGQQTEAVSETWAHETVQELLDFWEEQGVYIRE